MFRSPIVAGLMFRIVAVTASISAPTSPAQDVPATPTRIAEPAPDLDADLPLVEAPAEGTLVTVVDAATGEPVPGALVTWFSEGWEMPGDLIHLLDDNEMQAPGVGPSIHFDPPEGGDDLAPEPELRERRKSRGTTVRCGDDGTTRIGEYDKVIASHGGRYAGARCAAVTDESPPPSALVLALRQSRSFVVEVAAEDGSPAAGIPIELFAADEEAPSLTDGLTWNAVTDRRGRATFGPLDLFPQLAVVHPATATVRVAIPMAAPRRRVVTLSAPPEEPIRFRLPPLGRMTIDLADSRRRPIEEYGITCVGAGDDDSAPTSVKPWPAEDWSACDRRSHCQLPIEVGLRCRVSSDKGNGLEGLSRIVDGPVVPGETVAVELAEPPRAQVAGRLVDHSGRPLAAREWRLLIAGNADRLERQSFAEGVTDADGRFESWVDWDGDGFNDGAAIRKEHWLDLVATPGGDEPGLSATLHFDPLDDGARFELGEVELQPTPLLAGGTVVDDGGDPVAGAQLSFLLSPLDPHFEGMVDDSLLNNFCPRTDHDGRFALFADAPSAGCRISAWCAKELGEAFRYVSSEPQKFEPGCDSIRLVLWRRGTIRVKVVGTPPALEGLRCRTTSVRSDGVTEAEDDPVAADGSLETRITHGTVSLTFARDGSELVTIKGIDLDPGEVLTLPPIVIAPPVSNVELTIVDELGQPIESGWISLSDPDRETAAGKRTSPPRPPRPWFPDANIVPFKSGAASLHSDLPIPRFAVGAAGFAAVIVDHPAAAERVVLPPAPRVEVVVTAGGIALPPGLELLVTIRPTEDDDEWFRFGPESFGSSPSSSPPSLHSIVIAVDRSTALPIRCCGRMTAAMSLQHRVGNVTTILSVDCSPRTIEVECSRNLQRFDLRLDSASLASALAWFDKESRETNSEDR